MLLSETELRRWGGVIGREVELPAFLGLRGDLGAGKSVLARAIARGAGVSGNLPSPTFNLLYRYDSDRAANVVHMDLYRLQDAEEVWELGWEEFISGPDLVIVEWPERAEPHLPEDRWDIHLSPAPGDPLSRIVSVSRYGAPAELPAFPLSVRDRGDSGADVS